MEIPKEFTYSGLEKFARNNLIIWRIDEKEEIYMYSEVISASKCIESILLRLGVKENDKIGISFDHSTQIIPIILSILNVRCSFCPISVEIRDNQLQESLKRHKAKFFISSINYIGAKENNLQLLETYVLFKSSVYFYIYKEIDEICDTSLSSYRFCYSIQTSGSTGNTPKVVGVPYSCIMPNVKNLSLIYNITSEDVIFPFAPPTFDPFILDVLMVLINGACLLMTSNNIKLNSRKLVKVLNPTKSDKNNIGATIMQITSSVFKLLSPKIVDEVVSNEKSDLRVLVFGGEPFPSLNEIKSLKSWNFSKKKRIFNIYGITEISCWSTIQEIKKDLDEVSIGNQIDKETILQIKDLESNFIINEGIGELFIGSKTRKCLIDDENSLEILSSNEILYRSTGDLVSITKDKRIIFKGRTNEIVKRFGHRVNLRKIENILIEEELQKLEASCIFNKENSRLILFVSAKDNLLKDFIMNKLKKKLDSHEIPDEIIFIKKFPLSSHGKVSKKKLLEIYSTKKIEENYNDVYENNIVEIFQDWISQTLDLIGNGYNYSKHSKISWHSSSFTSLGGNSFQALSLVMKLEDFTKTTHPEILEMLLRSDCNLSEIFLKLKKIRCNTSVVKLLEMEDITTHRNFSLKVNWMYNTKKCIDANPALVILLKGNETIISVGSHSRELVNLKFDAGTIKSKLELPDRIESEVVVARDNCGIVGCYDGFLYKFDFICGSILWKFNSFGMIKCKALIFEEYAIFGNYSEGKNLFCVNTNDGTCSWSIKLGKKGILSSPVKLDEDTFIIGTLDGTFGRINLRTGEKLWQSRLNSPIFSTCSKLSQTYFLLAEVSGLIHCFDLFGKKCWQFKVDGTIFSSFEVFEQEKRQGLEESFLILFGCHDHNVYCLNFTVANLQIHLKWKIKLQSQIYSTPKKILFNDKYWILACATSGFLNILDVDNGEQKVFLQFGGEIFSSPAVYKNTIFIGCRDNNLYSVGIQ